ncbi:Zinc finger FYVE domain-containing protein 9 [Armadillidium vulgare]|nr:Zinc finger FYVE domain-containing protein 9 [Armadillidium vulgare]
MENFAIDIDKVLDDFELNEDEQESSQQYDKLQLQFRGDRTSTAYNNLPENDNEASCRNEDTKDCSFVEKEPPDKYGASSCDTQEPHNSVSCSDHASGSEIARESVFHQASNSNITSKFKEECESSVLSHSSQSSGNISSSNIQCDSEKLWPNISNQNFLFQDLSSGGTFQPFSGSLNLNVNNTGVSDSSDSTGSPGNVSTQAAFSIPSNQSLLACPLDVIPNEVPCTTGALVIQHDGQHPDLLGIRNLSDEKSFHLSRSDILHEVERQEIDGDHNSEVDELLPQVQVSPDIQREAFLLPDLMPSSNVDGGRLSLDLPPASEISNPAVVTENAVSLDNKPAIIQESQSYSKIPEVVNIHQSAELQNNTEFYNNSIAVAEDCSSDVIDIHDAVANNPCNWNTSDISDNISNRELPPPVCLPDVSEVHNFESQRIENISVDPSSLENNTPLVRFDPHCDVDEDELHSELQELEEEQARLQGAYCIKDCKVSDSKQSSTGIDNPQKLDLIGEISLSQECFSREPDAEVGACEENWELNANLREDTEDKPYLPVSDSSESDKPAQLPSSVPEEVNTNISDTVEERLTPDTIGTEREKMSESNEVKNIVLDSNVDENIVDNVVGAESSSVNEELAEIEVQEKSEINEETMSESTATDTLSSTSTLTDGEIVAPENPSHSSSERIPESPTLDSPSRQTPGTLVTAVYDDISARTRASSGSERDSSYIGAVAPFWIPDVEAPNCLECDIKFTIIRRRHHCRGCGRVLCAACCHFKAPLPYMDYKEDRVCATCLQILTHGKEEDKSDGNRQTGRAPNPNNPMEYCSRIPPQQQVGAIGNGPPPTVMVPVGVLKREPARNASGGRGVCNGERNKQLPGGLTPLRSVAPDECLIPSGGGLPPVLLKSSTNGEYLFDANPDSNKLEEQMINGMDPVVFALQKNLTVLVKRIKLDCCVGLDVWNVATRGLCNVGQEELVVLLEVNPEEKSPPPHLFAFLHTVYQQANKGNIVTELGHTIFTEPEGFLGSKDHGGFLYVRPTYQCLHKLLLPPAPYIFAVLIQKWETPWAKVFPLRLMLRLGAEFRYYPCPLVSTRTRKPVYCEIGHTIMNLLVDFRNYTYTVQVIQGFVIHMEDKKTTLLIPRNRYEQV